MHKKTLISLALATALLLSACSGVEREAKYPSGADRASTEGDIYSKPKSIFGGDGFKIGRDDDDNNSGSSGIGVNSFLWRASLDTVSFMPLASADPFGGVILTDWYSPPESPNERLKLNVFILDRQLRSDGIQVKVFRQVMKKSQWRDDTVADDTARKLEDAILMRARQMRVAQRDRNSEE